MKQMLYAALAFGLCSVVYAQAPLNFDVENRGKDLGATAGELKSNKKLPNPFEFHDGSKVTKYEIWLCPDTKFGKSNTTIKTVTKSYGTKTFTKLKKGKRYYVKVRAIKYVKGVKNVGKWSSRKYIKTKK